jgi:dihydroxyacetone kinase-like predicted kinase
MRVLLLVSCVIKRAGDFLHRTPRALSISRKNGVVPAGNNAISP